MCLYALPTLNSSGIARACAQETNSREAARTLKRPAQGYLEHQGASCRSASILAPLPGKQGSARLSQE